MLDLFDLEGKRAVVTGGASGLGYGISEALLQKGAKIAIIDIADNVDQVAAELSSEGKAIGLSGDLMNRKSRQKVFFEAVEALGGLDILVNNAGTQKRGCLLDFDDGDWDYVIELNLNAVYSLCKYAGKYMIPQKSGKIINIASMNSFFGGTNAPAYSASKGAVMQLTKAISNEWSKFGINANCIAPGFMETSLTKDMQDDPVVYQNKLTRIPAGRWGQPGDLAGTIQFLSSKASDYICGITIPVDGGYLCK